MKWGWVESINARDIVLLSRLQNRTNPRLKFEITAFGSKGIHALKKHVSNFVVERIDSRQREGDVFNRNALCAFKYDISLRYVVLFVSVFALKKPSL